MAHEILGERAYTLRQPSWHHLGIVSEVEQSAQEVLAAIGRIQVELFPVYTEVQGCKIELDERMVMRHPVPEDDCYVPFGMVGPEYVLITPDDVAAMWDKHVGKPIETMGLLQRGAILFATSKLPTISVAGDEVEMYLGVCSPMDGVRAASAEIWPLRVVCSNTLKAAQSAAKVSYRIVHDETAVERMGVWLHDAYEKAERNYLALKQAFEVLTTKQVSDAEAKAVLQATYPLPRLPRDNAPEDVMKQRLARWDALKPRLEQKRTDALALFRGAGTGMDTPAAKDTCWGLYNAVVELADYGQGSMRGGAQAESRRVAEATLFGDRADGKLRAYDACFALAKGEFELNDPGLN